MDAHAKSNPADESPPRAPDDPRDPADAAENPATSAARNIPRFLAELKSYAAYFVSAKIDSAKATGRGIAVQAALGLVGLLALAAAIFTAVFLLLGGIANLLGAAMGQRLWLGQVVVGVVVLCAIALGVWIGIKKFTGAARRKTEQKYEAKRNQQRADFGRDVHQRAQQAAGHDVR